MILIKNSQTSKTLEPTDHYAQHSTQWVEGKQSKATFLLRFPSFSSIPYKKNFVKINLPKNRCIVPTYTKFNTADVTSGAKKYILVQLCRYKLISKIFNTLSNHDDVGKSFKIKWAVTWDYSLNLCYLYERLV